MAPDPAGTARRERRQCGNARLSRTRSQGLRLCRPHAIHVGGQHPTTATNPGHIIKAGSDPGGFGSRQLNNFEVTPEGNGVTLEDEMMKVTANQMDYQAVTTLYSRSVRIIKLALGRQG
jgi:flagellar basal body rod protein FlgB